MAIELFRVDYNEVLVQYFPWAKLCIIRVPVALFLSGFRQMIELLCFFPGNVILVRGGGGLERTFVVLCEQGR